jgi:hypothetical protein
MTFIPLKQKLSPFLWSRPFPYPEGVQEDEVWRKEAVLQMGRMGFTHHESYQNALWSIEFRLASGVVFEGTNPRRPYATALAIDKVREAVESGSCPLSEHPLRNRA